MPSIAQAREELRKRFLLLIGKESAETVAIRDRVGVHGITIRRFLDGGTLTTRSLDKIEAWVEAQEKARPISRR